MFCRLNGATTIASPLRAILILLSGLAALRETREDRWGGAGENPHFWQKICGVAANGVIS